MSDQGKIDKLTREIGKLMLKIEKYEDRLDEYKSHMRHKKITKAEFQKKKHLISDHVRSLRGTIHRKEKARQAFERKIKEKREEEEREE